MSSGRAPIAMARLLPALLVAALMAGSTGCAGAPGQTPASAPDSDAAPVRSDPQAESGAAAEAPGGSPADARPSASKDPDPGREAAPLSEAEREFGLTFQPLANEFGFTRYVYAARTATGRGLFFEYLPADEDPEDWRYLGTVILTRVGDTWEDGDRVLPDYVAAFLSRMDRVNEAVTWQLPGGPVGFVDYELGQGEDREHVLATIWQVFPGHLAVFQAQRRPDRFSEWQIGHFRDIAQGLGRTPRSGSDSSPAP